MTFQIFVNGKIFANWKTAVLSRTIDQSVGKFQFSSSNVIPASYPVRVGDAIQILIDGIPKLTGFCDLVESSVEEGQDTITVSGRDNIQDLIDSSMPDAVKFVEGPISFVALCTGVISALGANIGILQSAQNIEDFTELELFIADAGKNCMDYLTDFARKRQVYLISDGNGNLDIFRPSEILLPGQLINEMENRSNNVISSSIKFDHSQRFNIYSVRGQDNFGADPDADYENGVDRQGLATDTSIRASRFLEIQPEENMFEEIIVDRATEELNIRISRSTEYRAVVQGTERSTGILWDIGQLTKISDDYAGLKGVFIVRSIQYAVDLRRGTTTTLTMAPPEAYNVRIPTEGDTRRAAQGPEFQNDDPDTTRTGPHR